MTEAELMAAFPNSPEMFRPSPAPAPPDPAMVAAFPKSARQMFGVDPPAAPVAGPAAPAVRAAPAVDDLFPNSPTMARAGAAPAGDAPAPPAIVPPAGIAADDPGFQAFTKLATEAGIKPDAASAMLKMHADALAAADYGRVEQATKWAEQTKADAEIGGARLDSTLAAARGVLDRHGSPALRQALEQSGLGNHPEVIRLLARVAGALDEW